MISLIEPALVWDDRSSGYQVRVTADGAHTEKLEHGAPLRLHSDYERAASHSITSSARTSKVDGTARPSALAVLRLITSSNLVGAWTGRSPGFAPRKMRSM